MLTNEILFKEVYPAPFDWHPELTELMIQVNDEEGGKFPSRMALLRVSLRNDQYVTLSLEHLLKSPLKKFVYHTDNFSKHPIEGLDFNEFCLDYGDDIIMFVEEQLVAQGILKKEEAVYSTMKQQLKNEYQRPTFADVLNIYIHNSHIPEIACYLEVCLIDKQVMLTAYHHPTGGVQLEVISALNHQYINHHSFLKRYEEGILSYLYTMIEKK